MWFEVCRVAVFVGVVVGVGVVVTVVGVVVGVVVAGDGGVVVGGGCVFVDVVEVVAHALQVFTAV